jgi:hypothetical protein
MAGGPQRRRRSKNSVPFSARLGALGVIFVEFRLETRREPGIAPKQGEMVPAGPSRRGGAGGRSVWQGRGSSRRATGAVPASAGECRRAGGEMVPAGRSRRGGAGGSAGAGAGGAVPHQLERLPHGGVFPALLHELIVRAHLEYPPMVEHDNPVGGLGRL